MHQMLIVSIYAALLALVFMVLSIRALRLRRRLRIPIGHADDESMLRAMRVHANFAEYVPFALLLIYLVETHGARPWFVHALSASLLLGRLVHASGVSRRREIFAYRVAGMTMTLTPLGLAAGYLLLAASRAA